LVFWVPVADISFDIYSTVRAATVTKATQKKRKWGIPPSPGYGRWRGRGGGVGGSDAADAGRRFGTAGRW